MGLAAGLVIFILALSGTLLTYEMQIKGWFDPQISPTVERAEMLSADELVAIAKPVPGKTATLDYYNDRSAPMTVKAGRHDAKLINPYSGAFIEAGGESFRRLFPLCSRFAPYPSDGGVRKCGSTSGQNFKSGLSVYRCIRHIPMASPPPLEVGGVHQAENLFFHATCPRQKPATSTGIMCFPSGH